MYNARVNRLAPVQSVGVATSAAKKEYRPRPVLLVTLMSVIGEPKGPFVGPKALTSSASETGRVGVKDASSSNRNPAVSAARASLCLFVSGMTFVPV